VKIDSPTFLTETTFISASVQFSSGSQKFGNTTDDTHQFTGSLQVGGNAFFREIGSGHQVYIDSDVGGISQIGTNTYTPLSIRANGNQAIYISQGAQVTINNLIGTAAQMGTLTSTGNIVSTGANALISGSSTSTGSFGHLKQNGNELPEFNSPGSDIAIGNDAGNAVDGTGANVMMGAAAMGVLALSLIPAAFAFSLLAGVDVGSMIAFSVALPLLSLAAAGLGFIAPFIMAGAGALAVLGLALIPASIAFGMIQGLDTNSIISFSKGIGVLALAAAGLGFASPFILAGAGALTMLGLALIPASIAFGMIQGLDTNSIISFATGVGILASTVALLGFAAPLITAGSFAMTALGLALIPLSIGFERMAAANVEGLVNSLQGLAGVTPQLFGVAAGLGAISAGLAGIAGAGFLALPAIGALTALGTVSEGLGSIFGGKADNKTATKNEEKSDNKIEVKDEGSMKAIEQKLDQLIAVVSKGGDVYIDGSKVGKTLQLATSRMG